MAINHLLSVMYRKKASSFLNQGLARNCRDNGSIRNQDIRLKMLSLNWWRSPKLVCMLHLPFHLFLCAHWGPTTCASAASSSERWYLGRSGPSTAEMMFLGCPSSDKSCAFWELNTTVQSHSFRGIYHYEPLKDPGNYQTFWRTKPLTTGRTSIYHQMANPLLKLSEHSQRPANDGS